MWLDENGVEVPFAIFDRGVPVPLGSSDVKLIFKKDLTRFEKVASVTGPGMGTVILGPTDITSAGTWFVQPIVTYQNGKKYRGNIKELIVEEGL